MRDLLENDLVIFDEINKQINECIGSKSYEVTNLVSRVKLFRSLIHEYVKIEEDGIDSDDEILNWAFSDVCDDLLCSISNMIIGYYKTSGSCLRNSLEMGIVALYFQVHQNELTDKAKYNEKFSKWDSGNSTPSLAVCMSYLKSKYENVAKSKVKIDIEIVPVVNRLYGELSNFSHGRAFRKPLEKSGAIATNNMNMGVGFNELSFDRFSQHLNDTVSCIATLWILCFPEILKDKEEKYVSLYSDLINEEKIKRILK